MTAIFFYSHCSSNPISPLNLLNILVFKRKTTIFVSYSESIVLFTMDSFCC